MVEQTQGAFQKNSLTPAELFDHRLAFFVLGCTVEEMLERLTPAQYMKAERFWLEEPWGPWRDNLHAAIISRAALAPHVRKGTKIDMDAFMIRDRAEEAPERVTSSIRFLFAVAKERGADKKAAKRARKAKRARSSK